jgi:hypothetical protein
MIKKSYRLQPCYKHCFVSKVAVVIPLARLKNFLVVILLIITTAGTLFPCCIVDECCAEQLATSSSHEKHQPEGNCSPFFACATCPGFVGLSKPIQLVLPVSEKQVHHERILNFHLTSYASAFWQPPRFN